LKFFFFSLSNHSFHPLLPIKFFLVTFFGPFTRVFLTRKLILFGEGGTRLVIFANSKGGVRFFVFHFILRSELMRFVRARRFRLHRIDEAFFVQQQLAQRSTLALDFLFVIVSVFLHCLPQLEHLNLNLSAGLVR